ncbi:hypothetical protein BGX31_002616, partial [Mortierella sp. GBA43]
MGVSGLPALIKKTKGTIAYDLEKKNCHVDLLSLHFGAMKIHCYNATATRIRKVATAEATVQTATVVKKRQATEPPGEQRATKLRAVDNPHSAQGSADRIKGIPVESFLDKVSFATKSSSRYDAQ